MMAAQHLSWWRRWSVSVSGSMSESSREMGSWIGSVVFMSVSGSVDENVGESDNGENVSNCGGDEEGE